MRERQPLTARGIHIPAQKMTTSAPRRHVIKYDERIGKTNTFGTGKGKKHPTAPWDRAVTVEGTCHRFGVPRKTSHQHPRTTLISPVSYLSSTLCVRTAVSDMESFLRGACLTCSQEDAASIRGFPIALPTSPRLVVGSSAHTPANPSCIPHCLPRIASPLSETTGRHSSMTTRFHRLHRCARPERWY